MSGKRCTKARACVALLLLAFYALMYSACRSSTFGTPGEGVQTSTTRPKTTSPAPFFRDLELSLCLKPFRVDSRRGSTPCPSGPIATVAQGGRLCNQIWEYAAVWATARATGLEPFVPGCIRDNIEPMFLNLSVPSLETIGHCPVPRVEFVPSLANWSEGQGVLLRKWSTEPDVVLRYLPELREEFSIREHWLEMARDEIGFARDVTDRRDDDVTLVGVHVRRTDYIVYLRNRFNVSAVDARFYVTAMRIFRRKYRKVLFMVVSDEPEWCWRYLGNESDVYVSGRRRASYPEGDLAIMSLCDHSIIDYGTYGAWGALVAGGETIYHYINEEYLTTKMARALGNWYTFNL